MRLVWTVGPITVFDLALFETTAPLSETDESSDPTVSDMSTTHERGIGFERAAWRMPPQNPDPYYDNPFGRSRERPT